MYQLFVNIPNCNGCRDCELACAAKQTETLDKLQRRPDKKLSHPAIKITKHSPTPGSLVSIKSFESKDNTLFFPFLCFHCVEAPCLDACISGAMKQDTQTGQVYVDQNQCVGCWSCIMVCPFGIIQPNTQAKPSRLSNPDVTSGGGQVAFKCDGCRDLAIPACVKFCLPKALVFQESSHFVNKKRRAQAQQLIKPYALHHRR